MTPEQGDKGGTTGGTKGVATGDHGHPVGVATKRPRLTVNEAVEATGTPRTTLRRMLVDQGAFPQAAKDKQGAWRIPVDDLLAAGLTLSRSATSGGGHEGDHGGTTGGTKEVATGDHGHPVSAEVEQLREELAEANQRAAVAEAVAAERDRMLADRDRIIAAQERTLRILEAGPAPSPSPTPNPSTDVPQSQPAPEPAYVDPFRAAEKPTTPAPAPMPMPMQPAPMSPASTSQPAPSEPKTKPSFWRRIFG